MENKKIRETLLVYYKYSTGTTRATLRQYIGDECAYIDDNATITLAATIYKAWVDKEGCLQYPLLLILPRGVYLADGSGSGLGGEDAERDVSYHLLDEEHAQRIMRYNGDTWWQALKKKIHFQWSWYAYKLSNCFRPRYDGSVDMTAPCHEEHEES